MFTVEIKRNKYKGTYPIFDNMAEFMKWCKEKNIKAEVVHWRDARKEDIGKYLIADDGKILQCLNVSYGKQHDAKLVYTPVGCFKHDKYSRKNIPHKMVIDPNIITTPGAFYGSKYPNNKVRYKTKKKLFAKLVANGVDVEVAYASAFGEKKDREYIRTSILKLLNDEVVRMAIKEEVKKAAEKIGFDHEYILRGLDSIYQNAKSDKIKLEAIEKLGDAIGTFEKEEEKQSVPNALGGFLEIIKTHKQLKGANSEGTSNEEASKEGK